MTDVPAAYRDAPRWPFGDSPELADELLALILAGGKRATCSSLAACEADIMPTVGEVSVILDGAGVPRCAIRTTEVEIMAFEDVGEDFARAEGRTILAINGGGTRTRPITAAKAAGRRA